MKTLDSELNLKRNIAIVGIIVYLFVLTVISVMFRNYALKPLWVVWGVAEVVLFFCLTFYFDFRWSKDEVKQFIRKTFWVALIIRVAYVVLMCYYYYYQTGIPFEYEAADSLNYHRIGVFLSKEVRQGNIGFVFQSLSANTMGFSDQGYLLWLTLIYTIFGKNILVPRLLKALMSAYMCVAVYKLASRSMDEKTGKLAAIICVFMPTLVRYAGLHYKETEMLFLAVMALERMDYLIRSRKYTFWNIAFPILLTAMTFGFRTILGMTLIAAFVIFTLLVNKDIVGKKAKAIIVLSTVVVFLVFLLTPIGNEMRIVFKMNFAEGRYNVEKYENEGMKFAQFADGKYLAPAAFILPLSSMVSVGNDNQKMMNGSIFIRNFLAFFSMWAIVIAIRGKKWRNLSLIGSYVILYLLLITFSFAFNSERYHFPAIPMAAVMAAYAITNMKKSDMKYFYIYNVLLIVAIIVWNYVKLAARGLI